MAIQVQGFGGVVAEVGGTTFRGLHVHIKPLEYGALGHYRYTVRILSTAAQVANSRILELRNPGTGSALTVLDRLEARAMQVAAGTAQENSLDFFKVTSFSAVDTTNTVTPTLSVKRTAGMAAAPTAQVRHLTITGVAAGMTGGTLTKDANAFSTFPYLVNTAVPTTPGAYWGPHVAVDDNGNWAHPFVFATNEGFEVENRVLNVTSYGIAWYFDLGFAEVTAF